MIYSARPAPDARRRRARLTRTAAVGLLLLLAGAAHAQGVHPIVAATEPLDERLRAADAIVIATVDAVGEDRIRLRDATPVLGHVPARFELKRPASSAPAMEPGQRVVLALQGARSPYILAGGPRSGVIANAPADEAHWTRELRELAAAAEDADARRQVYLAWLESGDAGLAALATRALLHPTRLFEPTPDALAVARARVALDPGRPEDVRAISAELAARSEAGRTALLEGLRDPRTAPPGVLSVAIRAALAGRDPHLPALVLGALEHPDAGLRRAALRAARALSDSELTERLTRIAESDPDARVRQEAQRILEARQRLRR